MKNDWIKIVIPLFIFLFGQTLISVWWASRITAVQEELLEDITAIKDQVSDICSRQEIQEAFAIRDKNVGYLEQRVSRLEEFFFDRSKTTSPTIISP
jgi:tRNA(Ser,Leu) C12 N-acetylase TAN1